MRVSVNNALHTPEDLPRLLQRFLAGLGLRHIPGQVLVRRRQVPQPVDLHQPVKVIILPLLGGPQLDRKSVV